MKPVKFFLIFFVLLSNIALCNEEKFDINKHCNEFEIEFSNYLDYMFYFFKADVYYQQEENNIDLLNYAKGALDAVIAIQYSYKLELKKKWSNFYR